MTLNRGKFSKQVKGQGQGQGQGQRKSQVQRKGQGQVGGACGSDYSGLWHSWEISPAELSRITLEGIDCAPMFNPLRRGTIFPTGTSGITPTGVYLANIAPYNDSCITVECMGRRPLPNTQVPRDDIVANPGAPDALSGQAGGGVGGLAYGPYCTNCRGTRGGCGRCRGGVRGAYGVRSSDGVGSCGRGGRAGRAPVYYSETSSPEGCTSRCRMPPARHASSQIGCKSLAEAGVKNVDYETYLYLRANDMQERIDTARKCYCGKCTKWNQKCSGSRCRPTGPKCGTGGCGCGCGSGAPCWCKGGF